MTDPWQIQKQPAINNEKDNFAPNISNASKREESLEFEDNFAPNTNNSILQPLPDSASYLRSLERKLQKIQKESKLLDALGEKKQQCLRTLLQEDIDDQQSGTSYSNNNELLEFDAPIANSESTVQGIYRHLQPVQPLAVGEIVHILKYDQLLSKEGTNQHQETEDDSDDSEESAETL